ncbi:siderophore-interacting protein [Streptomyces sp. NPDC059567]|uniref:siderophore-interacting protein n=1 Tax=Streptomyces sp. NPDC059567 TaxID=3346867 RepID=UPI0036C54D34
MGPRHAGRWPRGPATRWACSDRRRTSPSRSSSGAADWTLLVADGCSLPALATLAEALPPGHRALAFVQVPDAAEEQPLATAGALTVHWLHGNASVVAAVREAALPSGAPYVWLGGEAGTVRALRLT